MKTAPDTSVHENTDPIPQCEVPEGNQETANETRTGNGKFAKGNRGGPGNPFARQTARLRQAMLDAVSPEKMQAIIAAMTKKAIEGDVAAAKLIMSYSIGKPTPPENPDTLDQHELKTIMANHLDSSEGPVNIVKGMPLDVLVEMFRLILPILRSAKVQMAKDVLCPPLTEEEKEDYCDNYDNNDDEESSSTSADEPARDPLENIPQWMLDIGTEPEPDQPAPKPARKRKGTPRADAAPQEETPRPVQPRVDAELLQVLLERARQLKAANPSATGDDPVSAQAAQEIAELLTSRNGQHPPSTNGSNGKKS